MPRRSSGRTPSRSFTSAPAPVRRTQTLPTRAPPSAPANATATPKQPGMFAQMATTAAGVAVGSAVGHTIGAAMTGGGGHQQVEAAPPQQQQYEQESNLSGGRCAIELRDFLQCTQNQTDISLCSGFNEALKECKMRYGSAM